MNDKKFARLSRRFVGHIEALNATKLIATSLLNSRIQRVLTIVRRYRSSVVEKNDNSARTKTGRRGWENNDYYL